MYGFKGLVKLVFPEQNEDHKQYLPVGCLRKVKKMCLCAVTSWYHSKYYPIIPFIGSFFFFLISLKNKRCVCLKEEVVPVF